MRAQDLLGGLRRRRWCLWCAAPAPPAPAMQLCAHHTAFWPQLAADVFLAEACAAFADGDDDLAHLWMSVADHAARTTP